ncbi:MAG: viperin family antiviral radical SAM protein [Oscillospiraceae bacterium]|nr:viperin family antiviral radical SAM protein [Oscillospiraceae bacterium]
MNKIKVNIHLTEACNYHCRYCFAHFDKHVSPSKEQWKKIIDNVVDSGRVYEINFAGGEPMLVPYLNELAEYVNSKGLSCSLISNGSLMNEEWIRNYSGLFRTIGLSVDSFSEGTAAEIGRCTRRGEVQNKERIAAIIRTIKAYHPEVKIKINTVVNALNKNEVPALFLKENNLPVDRWKILKMSYFNDGCFDNSYLEVSYEEYNEFVRNNLSVIGCNSVTEGLVLYETELIKEVVAEKEITGSYYMIDAGGYLVDDTFNSSYTRVINCLTEPFAYGMEKLTLYDDVYNSRYRPA